MKISKIRIDGQMFLLEPDQSVEELKERIVDSARKGAEFVQFEAVGYGRVSVLATANIPVRIEELERTEDQLAELEKDPPPIDVTGDPDQYADYFDLYAAR